MRVLAAAVLLCFATAARALAPEIPAPPAAPVLPVIAGNFPADSFPDHEKALADIWEFVKSLGGAGADLPPPIIYFSAFDPRVQDPEWTAWQKQWGDSRGMILDWLCSPAGLKKYPGVTRDTCLRGDGAVSAWLRAHPEAADEFPFEPNVLSFHYTGTNRIQINPSETFLKYSPYAGYGYYVAGHEMLHYVLSSRGVPGPTHHCLFVTDDKEGQAPMWRLAAFLIDRGYANFTIRRYGFAEEASKMPCGQAR